MLATALVPSIEDMGCLNVQDLQRVRLFTTGLRAEIQWHDVTGTIGWDPVRQELHVELVHADLVSEVETRNSFRVGTVKVRQGYGDRRYMLCPHTGERVGKLYFNSDVDALGSRKAWGLSYFSQLASPEERKWMEAAQLAHALVGRSGPRGYIPLSAKRKDQILRRLHELGLWAEYRPYTQRAITDWARAQGVPLPGEGASQADTGSPSGASATPAQIIFVAPGRDRRRARKADYEHLLAALVKGGGDVAKAAEILGMSREAAELRRLAPRGAESNRTRR